MVRNIVILAKGNSSEKEISEKSGLNVLKGLISSNLSNGNIKNKVLLLNPILDYEFKDFFYNENEIIEFFNQGKMGEGVNISDSVIKICKKSDIVFNLLHGGNGENGLIRAVLEINNIKCTGSNYESLSISMDKEISKILFKGLNLNVPEDLNYIDNNSDENDWVVKPYNGGSSIGTFIFDTKEKALKYVNNSKEKLIIERRIIGREFTVGILNNKALCVTEIISNNNFYDYESKYVKNKAKEITPAKISKDLENRLLNISECIHNKFKMTNYSRIDFIYDEKSDKIYVLEINALPGMTELSLLPQQAKYLGVGFSELCEKMLDI